MTDREKIVKGLECCASMNGSACRECPYSSECVTGEALYQTGTAHLAADALSLLKEKEWIPVTERLPEVRHAVLCFTPHNKNIWALSLHEDNEWYYWIPMYKKYNPDFEGDITHWMPLPEYPKEGR